MSGGGGDVINPNTKYPQQAWELLQFMNSAEAIKAARRRRRGSPSDDVNERGARRRPDAELRRREGPADHRVPAGLAEYPQVSAALQQATADVVAGKSADEAARRTRRRVEGIVGGSRQRHRH